MNTQHLLKGKLRMRKIMPIILTMVIIFSVVFFLFYCSLEKSNIDCCKINREYIQVTITAIINGKFDEGKKQVDKNGDYYIDIKNSTLKETIIYKGEKTYGFNVANEDLRISDIRGDFWQGKVSDDLNLKLILSEENIFCPVTNKDETINYYILENGDVVCINSKCN